MRQFFLFLFIQTFLYSTNIILMEPERHKDSIPDVEIQLEEGFKREGKGFLQRVKDAIRGKRIKSAESIAYPDGSYTIYVGYDEFGDVTKL